MAGLCAGALFLSGGCRRTPEQRLVDELAGALPREAVASGVVRTFDLVAAPAKVTVGEGRTLDVWAYNGTVPGPTFRVRLGETLRVRFKNELPQPTTVHWHGVRVPNGMDGVPGLTQPAVQPGGSFTYEFTPKDAGTFWFHPHVRSSEQVARGLYGVLVVEDREPPPYTRDVVWVLDDWLLGEDGQIFPEFNTPHDLAHDGRWGNLVTVNSRTDTLLPARSGDRIRLRLLNSANGRVFAPELAPADAHVDAQVIAVDGTYLRAPVPLAGFEVAPGNRLDLDVRVQAGASVRVALWITSPNACRTTWRTSRWTGWRSARPRRSRRRRTRWFRAGRRRCRCRRPRSFDSTRGAGAAMASSGPSTTEPSKDTCSTAAVPAPPDTFMRRRMLRR